MNRLKNKIAAITGGVSGIGLATAKRFLDEGASVAIFDLHDPGDVVAELGERAIGYQGSVTDTQDLENFYALVKETHGGLDVIFANAGNGKYTNVKKEQGDSLDLMLDVHTKGVFFTIQKALPCLNSGASVVITSSNAGIQGFPYLSAYSAAKAASAALARSLSVDLKERKIRVNSIAPGLIDTPGHQVMNVPREDVISAGKTLNVLGRAGTPEEIANTVLFLASDESSFIVGANILVDGGQLLL